MKKIFVSGFIVLGFLFNAIKVFAANINSHPTSIHAHYAHHYYIVHFGLLAKALYFGLSALGGGLATGLGVIGTGAGMGSAVRGALEAMGKNPDMEKKLIVWMITGMAIMESLALYALLITFIIFYANPFKSIILK
jgi:F-type H+-transporting ATPase subunit c